MLIKHFQVLQNKLKINSETVLTESESLPSLQLRYDLVTLVTASYVIYSK